MASLRFHEDGAEHFKGAVSADDLKGLESALAQLPPGRAGVRIAGMTDRLKGFVAAASPIGAIANSLSKATCRPVRAILFDKTGRS